MRLIFLGTGGYHPNERRHTAGILLPESGVVFDAGTSLFRLPSLLQTSEVDIFLTHSHLDHIVGLTFLLGPLLKGQLTQCRVHASPGTIDAVRQHLFSQSLFPVMPQIEFVTLADRVELNRGGGSLTHHPLNHPGGSLGFKIEQDNRTIAYVTDTTVDGTYTDFIRNVDLLIHECYFPDEMSSWAAKTGHSYATQVALLAKEANVKQMCLTHIDPQRSDDDPIGIAAIRAIFPKAVIAEDLMEIEI